MVNTSGRILTRLQFEPSFIVFQKLFVEISER